MKIPLDIGGYRILVEEPRDRMCYFWPNRRFGMFRGRKAAPADITIQVNLVEKLPALKKRPLLFNSGAGLWKLFDDPDGFLYEGCDAATRVPLMHARMSPDFTRVHVTLHTIRPRHAPRGGWSPMAFFNPLLEIVLQERLSRDRGVFLHCSAVLFRGEVFVFSGPSGAGKSTLADFFKQRGARVLNDERVVVREIGGQFHAFGTPWPGSRFLFSAATGPIARFLSIRHGQVRHRLDEIPRREMITRLLQESFLPHWDPEGVNGTIDLFERLCDRYGCLQLLSCKTPDIVDFLTAPALARAQ